MSISRICAASGKQFTITDEDLAFYEKVSPTFAGKKYLIPPPTLCPEGRKQRRLSFLNQRNLYKNVCLKSGKNIISRFSIARGIKNYSNESWSAEDWDQLEFWKEVDFTRPMFEQYAYLTENTIYQNLIGSSSNVENNAEYTSHTSEIKDSFYVFEANKITDSFYSFSLRVCDQVVDCCFMGSSQHAYECVDSYDMLQSFYCTSSYWSKFSYFLDNCMNCDFCIGCTNLKNKSYFIFNEPSTKEVYEKMVQDLADYDHFIAFRKKYHTFLQKRIVKSANIVGSEDCIWNNIIRSSNCTNSFDVLDCSNCRYCTNTSNSTDLFDISSYGEYSDRMYESVSVGRYSNNILFSSIVGKWENLIYCMDVKRSSNCFLCVNLENKKYCILNKQYSKEEYEVLVPQIIEHMQKTGEWGEFFPVCLSPFGYNETVAQEHFKLDRVWALERGYNWSDYEPPFPQVQKTIPASRLPKTVAEVPDDILNWAIECEITKKPFRVIEQELKFYRKHNLPIPRRHPDQRHAERMSARMPDKLYERICDCEGCKEHADTIGSYSEKDFSEHLITKKQARKILTPYSPDRTEIVYCEVCFNKQFF